MQINYFDEILDISRELHLEILLFIEIINLCSYHRSTIGCDFKGGSSLRHGAVVGEKLERTSLKLIAIHFKRLNGVATATQVKRSKPRVLAVFRPVFDGSFNLRSARSPLPFDLKTVRPHTSDFFVSTKGEVDISFFAFRAEIDDLDDDVLVLNGTSGISAPGKQKRKKRRRKSNVNPKLPRSIRNT
jgi:hypothetical protein